MKKVLKYITLVFLTTSCSSLNFIFLKVLTLYLSFVGRVGNVAGLLRPRSWRSISYVRIVKLSHILPSFVHDHFIILDGSAPSMTFQPQVSLLFVMSQRTKTQRYFFFFWLVNFLVILYYDYVLTLPQEIQLLWSPHNKNRWFTLAFFLNRYIPIIGVLPIVVSYFIPVNIAVRSPSLTSQV